jgi:hypothetical protein
VEQKVGKNIVICLDGTGNHFKEETSVTKAGRGKRRASAARAGARTPIERRPRARLAKALRAAPPVQAHFPLMPWARCPGRGSAGPMVVRGGDAALTRRGVRADSGEVGRICVARPGVPACAGAVFAEDWTGDRFRTPFILLILGDSRASLPAKYCYSCCNILLQIGNTRMSPLGTQRKYRACIS